jgi:hypothetical protein
VEVAPGILKVWDRGDVVWTVRREGDRWILESALKPGGQAAPAWQELGEIPADPNARHVSIVITGCPVAPVEMRGNYVSGRQRLIRTHDPVRVPPMAAIVSTREVDPQPALDRIRGRLDGTEPPDDPRRSHVRTEHEGVDFQPPASLAEWQSQAAALREHLTVTLGLRPAFAVAPLNVRVTRRQERDGYTIEDVVLETMPGLFLAGNLYRPSAHEGRGPAVLSPHGHYSEGRYAIDVQQRAINWAKRGAVVFSYDMVGYADSKGFGHSFASDELTRAGLSLATLQTWNSLRAVDWVSRLDDVDPTQIACTGESGGGTQTYLLTAIEPRVRWSAPVVMVSDAYQGGCECENGPGLRWGIDNMMIAALAAPRPMILVGATGDWTAYTQTRIAPVLRRIYDLYGAGDRFESVVHDFEHNYNKTSRESVTRFLAPRMLGQTDPATWAEGEQMPESENELGVFASGRPRPQGELTARELAGRLVTARLEAVAKLLPGDDVAAWDVNRRELEAIHRVRTGITVPSAADLKSYEIRRTVSEPSGSTAVHLEILQLSTGIRIPVTRVEPKRRGTPGAAVIVVSPGGRGGLVDDSGDWSPLVREILSRGLVVVGFDPLLTGESVDSADAQASRPTLRHALTYNPTLAIDRMRDLATVVTATKAIEGIEVVHLVGLKESGNDVLLARPRLTGIGRTYVERGEVHAGSWPGIDQFGGLEGAASLVAPEPLWIVGDPSRINPAKSYALAGTPAMLQLDPTTPEWAALADWLADGRR